MPIARRTILPRNSYSRKNCGEVSMGYRGEVPFSEGCVSSHLDLISVVGGGSGLVRTFGCRTRTCPSKSVSSVLSTSKFLLRTRVSSYLTSPN